MNNRNIYGGSTLNTYEQHSKRKLIATVLSIAVIAGLVVFTDHAKSKSTAADTASAQTSINTPAPTDTTSPADTATTITPTPSTATPGIKDGTYSATSSYYVPHGNESIQVSLTVSGGVVSSVSIQNSEGDHDSAYYQEEFAAAYKSYVVGKKVSGLQISTVAGASDTTQAFNDALSQIATKAQS